MQDRTKVETKKNRFSLSLRGLLVFLGLAQVWRGELVDVFGGSQSVLALSGGRPTGRMAAGTNDEAGEQTVENLGRDVAIRRWLESVDYL